MATIVKAPQPYTLKTFNLFLGGAIDMGSARNWQLEVELALSKENLLILNPRRDDWDSSWKQESSNPQFREQVLWEMIGQESCNLLMYVFTKDSKAPITFLEMGAYTKDTTKIVAVVVEDGFYRKGNVDLFCERYNVPCYNSIDGAIQFFQSFLKIEGEYERNT